MAGRLDNKVAVITGGTSGIGEATVELFIEQGAKVVFCGRSEEKGKALAERVGNNAVFVVADVMSESDIKRTIDTAIDTFGGLDILFNNAGGPTQGDVTDVDEDKIHYAMQLLFSSAVLGMKHAVPHLEARGGGAIINNSSVAGIRDNQGNLLYSAAKAALTHYSRLAGVHLGPKGIRVNTLSPGAIATPIFWGGSARANTLTDEQNDTKMQKLEDNLAKANPLKVSGHARDIAEGALYLGSDEGLFVNSLDLVIDGGRTHMFHEPPAS
jgi:NAD(P)-dependent dehydrogenase (short-subunit alcohol dehydrogenase family)